MKAHDYHAHLRLLSLIAGDGHTQGWKIDETRALACAYARQSPRRYRHHACRRVITLFYSLRLHSCPLSPRLDEHVLIAMNERRWIVVLSTILDGALCTGCDFQPPKDNSIWKLPAITRRYQHQISAGGIFLQPFYTEIKMVDPSVNYSREICMKKKKEKKKETCFFFHASSL